MRSERDAVRQAVDQTLSAHPRGGAMTQRLAGDLFLDDKPMTPSAPERLEVTQPYIPAIRERPPEFLQSRAGATPTTPLAGGHGPLPAPTPIPPNLPAAPQAPPVAPAPEFTAGSTVAGGNTPQATPKPRQRRSLARRVVRTILGPDLLRKDPPRKKK